MQTMMKIKMKNAKSLNDASLEEVKCFYISYISELRFENKFKRMNTLKSYKYVYDSNFSCIVVYNKGKI